jgi:hypothetical protein
MNVLFIILHKYLPQMHGGMQSSTDELCHGLIGRGHRVAVLAGLSIRLEVPYQDGIRNVRPMSASLTPAVYMIP